MLINRVVVCIAALGCGVTWCVLLCGVAVCWCFCLLLLLLADAVWNTYALCLLCGVFRVVVLVCLFSCDVVLYIRLDLYLSIYIAMPCCVSVSWWYVVAHCVDCVVCCAVLLCAVLLCSLCGVLWCCVLSVACCSVVFFVWCAVALCFLCGVL